MAVVVSGDERTTMQQAQLGMFFAALTAWVVCGCIFTRKPRKKLPTQTLRKAAADERQSGCFGLEEERGSHWTGSGVPIINEARPSL
jgi:hypothetical protein